MGEEKWLMRIQSLHSLKNYNQKMQNCQKMQEQKLMYLSHWSRATVRKKSTDDVRKLSQRKQYWLNHRFAVNYPVGLRS